MLLAEHDDNKSVAYERKCQDCGHHIPIDWHSQGRRPVPGRPIDVITRIVKITLA